MVGEDDVSLRVEIERRQVQTQFEVRIIEKDQLITTTILWSVLLYRGRACKEATYLAFPAFGSIELFLDLIILSMSRILLIMSLRTNLIWFSWHRTTP